MRPDLAEADPASLLRQLIRCPSVTPEPAGVLELLRDWLTGLGFTVELVAFEGDGSYRVENLFATRGETGPHLLFAGHTDVVPPGDSAAWAHPPFAAEEADGRLYGRGAADMKSGIAAFVAAAASAIRAGEAETGRISLAITNDEEADGINGTEKLMAWAAERGQRFDFAIVGEPSSTGTVGDGIKIGRRGSLNAEITVTGVQGHVAYPEKARNPLPLLAGIVTALSGPLDAGSGAFPPSNLEFTSLDVGNPISNVIPGAARARLNVRFNDGWTPETLAAHLGSRLAEVAGPAARLTVLGRPSRSFLSPAGDALELLAETIAAETGSRPQFSTGGGTSDARFIAPYCPVAEFGIVGPTMHQVDESITLADLAALATIYRRFIARFLAA
jgi:succinyl-diaminopimelate desuccinylase